MSPDLSQREIAEMFLAPDWATKFPPILSVELAAELIQVPKSTIYDWRSRGLLDRCSRRVGKRVIFVRDRLVQLVFNEGLTNE
jgi:hypothetical protein